MGGKKEGPRQVIAGTRSTMFMVDPEELTLIGRDTKDGEEHPLYDPRANREADPSWVAITKRKGVIKPVVVRKVDGDVQVVDGRFRVINCRAANIDLQIEGKPLRLVPVKMEKGSDEDAFETMVMTNHFSRRPSPVESAHLLRRYLSFEGKTEKDAADIFDVTSRTIKNWVVLLKLDPKVQDAVEQGKLSSSAAAKLAPLPRKEQRTKLKKLVAAVPEGKRVSVTTAARGAGTASATQRAPSKKVVHKLLALGEESGLDEQFLLGVRWVMGEVSDKQVTGMAKLLRKVEP